MSLSMPREISEYSICSMGAANGLGADLGEPDVLDPALGHHLGQRTDRLFDRDAGIEARGPVDVDRLDAEPLQRIGEKILDGRWTAVIAEEVSLDVTQRAELDRDLHIAPVAGGQRLADQQLVVAHAVEIAGVEQRDAGVERGMDGRDALAAVGRAVDIGHAHAAEPDRADDGTCLAEFACVHDWFLLKGGGSFAAAGHGGYGASRLRR
jgi:hypothetical protein